MSLGLSLVTSPAWRISPTSESWSSWAIHCAGTCRVAEGWPGPFALSCCTGTGTDLILDRVVGDHREVVKNAAERVTRILTDAMR